MPACKRETPIEKRRFTGTLTGRRMMDYEQLRAEYPELYLEVDARVIRSLDCNESVMLGYHENSFKRVR